MNKSELMRSMALGQYHAVAAEFDRMDRDNATLRQRIAELESRLSECEYALVGMVEQYCRAWYEAFYYERFSSDEKAFEYLLSRDIAERTADDGIRIKQMEEK